MAVTGTVTGVVVVVGGRAAVVDVVRVLVDVALGARVGDFAPDELSSDVHPKAAITRNSATAARNRDITSTYRRLRTSRDATARGRADPERAIRATGE
jgi:hypothetical protein